MKVDEKKGPDEFLEAPKDEKGLTRRDFLRGAAISATVMAGAAVVAPVDAASTGGPGALDTGKENARWGMIVDSEKCVRARACMMACKIENNTPPGVDYNVTVEEEEGIDEDLHSRYIFRPCNHCEHPPCCKVCPTGASIKRHQDGIVAIDYELCIGCRYCIAACPYCARSFDYGHHFGDPGPPLPFESAESPEYRENRVREGNKPPVNCTRKCSFCMHRIIEGLAPACATACPYNVIHFGDLNDPEGKCLIHGESLRELLRSRSSFRIKEELGTEPSVFYLT